MTVLLSWIHYSEFGAMSWSSVFTSVNASRWPTCVWVCIGVYECWPQYWKHVCSEGINELSECILSTCWHQLWAEVVQLKCSRQWSSKAILSCKAAANHCNSHNAGRYIDKWGISFFHWFEYTKNWLRDFTKGVFVLFLSCKLQALNFWVGFQELKEWVRYSYMKEVKKKCLRPI